MYDSVKLLEFTQKESMEFVLLFWKEQESQTLNYYEYSGGTNWKNWRDQGLSARVD